MPVTIKDIAEYAKVSTATVSMALQDSPRVAQKTKDRIQRLAADLGYLPSGLGRALQSGKSGLIGYMIPHVNASFFSEILQGVGCEAAARGYGLLTAITGRYGEEALKQLRIFREKRIDGLLVSSCGSIFLPHLLEIEKAGCPLTFCSLIPPIQGIPYAVTDDFAGGRLAAEHMLEKGARRIAYFTEYKITERRFDGASSACPSLRRLGSTTALAEALAEPENSRPDALIAYSDMAAMTARDAIIKAGLRIPEDVMLIGFDNSPFTEFDDVSLSSISPEKDGVGREAVRLLMERIEGRSPEPSLLAPKLFARRSTKCG